MRCFFKYVILTAFLVAPYLSFAQGVALVLSGGGAKAFAHVGVLKALEENDIPIDYIIGNSMGAIIGALYASGYSPKEIEAILNNADFIQFTKESSSKDACFYQNDEKSASFVRFTFNVDKGFNVQIPLNVYDFKEIDYQLMELFAGAGALSNSNFDSLMIPFRCIASDVDSSRMVVFRNGNLTKAVRASVTFPFFVRPIDIDGVVYFDGGMYDNFPVDVAIDEFNPDFLIGSKAVNNFESPNPDNAISLMQSMLMTKANFGIDSTLGVIIESNTGEGTIFQFSKVGTYIDSGYVAANRMIVGIKNRLQKPDIKDLPRTKRKQFNERMGKVQFKSINVKGLNNKQQKYFQKLIGDIDRFNDTKKFHRFYSCLISNENITSVYPEIEYDSLLNEFNLNLLMKKTEPFHLHLGGYISSSGVNEGFLDLGFNYFGKSAKNINIGAYFGTFYNSISTIAKIEFPYRVPITLKLKFLASRKNYFSNARYFLEDKFPAYIITDENYLDFSIGIPVNYTGVAAIGLSNINAYYQYYQDNYFSRTDTADVSNFYYLSPWIEYQINTLNQKLYPTQGQMLYTSFSYYTGFEKYTEGSGKTPQQEISSNLSYLSLVVRYLKLFRLNTEVSVGISGELGYSTKPLLSNYISSLLIATPYEPIPVMKTLFLENFRANNYGGIGAVFDYSFVKNFNIRLDGYYYLPYEKINKGVAGNNAYLSKPFNHQYFLGSARIIYHPPIGVISASVNYIEKPGSKFGFLINLGYLIFNKSKLNK